MKMFMFFCFLIVCIAFAKSKTIDTKFKDQIKAMDDVNAKDEVLARKHYC